MSNQVYEQQHPIRLRSAPFWPHILMMVFGAGWAVSFDVGVRVYGAEVVAAVGLVGFVLAGVGGAVRRYPVARRVLGAYAFWVFAIAIADFANGTALFDTARNMATPIIGGGSMLFALTILMRNPHALLTFLAATAVAKGVMGEPLYGDAFAGYSFGWDSIQQDSNYFKVRIDPFLTPSVLLVACQIGRKNLLLAAAILLVASIGYSVLDARSSSTVFFLSALTLTGIHFRVRIKFRQIVISGLLAAIVGYGAYAAYVNYTLENNLEGHNGKQLVHMQNPYNPMELLLQGRSEWLVMPSAIAERPVFGWGSWAIDPNFRFTSLRARRLETVYDEFDLVGVTTYIPAHSVIGSAWVWSGILGFVAAMRLLYIVLKSSLRLPYVEARLTPAVIFLTVMLIWHFLFSPPQNVRLFFPVALASLIVSTADVRRWILVSPQATPVLAIR